MYMNISVYHIFIDDVFFSICVPFMSRHDSIPIPHLLQFMKATFWKRILKWSLTDTVLIMQLLILSNRGLVSTIIHKQIDFIKILISECTLNIL